VFELSITDDIPDLQRLIEKLEPRQLSGAMKNIGEAGVGLARESFQMGKNPYGEAWAPLKESTLEAFVGRGGRQRKSYGARPLVRTSTLMSSLNWSLVMDGSAVAIGVSQRYGKYHQGDPDIPSKGIVPQRAFLPIEDRGLPEAWREELIDAVESYLGVDA